MNQTNQLLDVPTAARQLGLARTTLNESILAGRLQATRIGQRWVITPDDLRRYATQHPPAPATQPNPHAEHARRAVLGALADRDGATVAQLADALATPRRTILAYTQALDWDRLIERRRGRDPKDPHHCWLTRAGREALGLGSIPEAEAS